LGCPFIRVFPNDLPKDQPENETIDIIIRSLQELGDFAQKTGVKVLLESHGKVIKSDMLLHIMQSTNHPQVGLVWDFFNMWSVSQEAPAQVYQTLKNTFCIRTSKTRFFMKQVKNIPCWATETRPSKKPCTH